MTDDHQKTILITGASRGIGRALCETALKRGYSVHGLVRKTGTAPQGVQEHVGDLRDRKRVAELMRELAPRIDWYLANAGISYNINPSKPEAAEQAAETMDINGTATIYSIYALAYEWIRLGLRERRIGVVSSLAAGRGLPRTSVYAASKAAQLVACQGLEHDLGRNGIEVSVIQPGFIETEMSADLPSRPFLISAQDAAERIFRGMEQGRFKIAFPQSTTWLARVGDNMPDWMMRPAIRQMLKRKML